MSQTTGAKRWCRGRHPESGLRTNYGGTAGGPCGAISIATLHDAGGESRDTATTSCPPAIGVMCIFQGYFFRRPEVLKAKEIPSNRMNYLRMLEAVSRAELDVRELKT